MAVMVDSIGTMTSAVASLSFGDFVTYNASDLSQYGLDQPKTTIRVHYTEEQEVEADDTTTADTSSDSTADSSSSDSTATSSSSETTTVTGRKIWYCMSVMQMRTAVLIT